MKKTLVIISTITLMLCMCLSVVAADVPSVEIPEAPEVMNAVINKGDDTEKNTTYDITTLEQAKNE